MSNFLEAELENFASSGFSTIFFWNKTKYKIKHDSSGEK